ncbi:uncharacterized protein LOC131641086 [Vicia villosa]|uniref:uncharacterized protein LOC131641086 n=1 Tax=Vicia villosa TaxID=3911 RepID=UPI00273C61B3|nr:uncharacterized protein LOC131641086 [Vicia villosa]
MNRNNNIITWNCRGAAGKDFYRYVKHLRDIYHLVILVIMETRCDPCRVAKTLKKLGFHDYVANSNNGFAGGIIVAWREDSVHLCSGGIEEQYIHLKVEQKQGPEWFFTAIYASPNDMKRRILWDQIKHMASSVNSSWLLAGDFNDIAFAHEKKGGAPASSRKCKLFRDNMNDCNLLDLGANGPAYTWRGPIYHGGQRIFERLDRALSNENWRLQFHEASIKVLPRVDFSDHHPIMINLTNSMNVQGPRRFRFESAWMVDENYKNRLVGIWKKEESLKNNLKLVEDDTSNWKCNSLNHMQQAKKQIMARLNGV